MNLTGTFFFRLFITRRIKQSLPTRDIYHFYKYMSVFRYSLLVLPSNAVLQLISGFLDIYDQVFLSNILNASSKVLSSCGFGKASGIAILESQTGCPVLLGGLK